MSRHVFILILRFKISYFVMSETESALSCRLSCNTRLGLDAFMLGLAPLQSAALGVPSGRGLRESSLGNVNGWEWVLKLIHLHVFIYVLILFPKLLLWASLLALLPRWDTYNAMSSGPIGIRPQEPRSTLNVQECYSSCAMWKLQVSSRSVAKSEMITLRQTRGSVEIRDKEPTRDVSPDIIFVCPPVGKGKGRRLAK